MTLTFDDPAFLKMIRNAVLIAIISGIVFSVIFLYQDRESYSGLFLYPNATVFEKPSDTVYFTYGVICQETGRTDYNLDIYANQTLMMNKKFTLNPKEMQEERIKLTLPSATQYTEEISLKLDTGKTKEEVHFWIDK